MTPPRSPEPVSAAGDVAGAAYVALCDEIAETQGIINLAEARLVSLAARGLEMGVSGGTNLPDKAWLAWRAGISPERASSIVKIAERAAELPHTMAALDAGALTIDQAAVIARHIPVRYEESAARVAPFLTVAQLRKALPHYRDRKPDKPKPESDPEAHGHVSSRSDESGYHLHLHLPDVAKGAIIDQAIKTMHEDLKRQARADAPEGCAPQPVYATDALVALAETALRAGEAARPGSERYLVVVHLEAGADGTVELMTHLGIPIPDGERRHILCDPRLQALVHHGTTPLGCGRTTRTINRKLRRAIEHRDHGSCSVPGCGRTTGLEIHHIIHWEDGGATETWNLIALCAHHHRCHHTGTLGIAGNADLPRHTEPGVEFTNGWGHPLDPSGQPILPAHRPPGTDPGRHITESAQRGGIAPHTYLPPTGEPLDRWGFHLREADPPPPPASDHDGGTGDGEDQPPPSITGHRPDTALPPPNGPEGPGGADPSRAGPGAA